MSASRRPVTEPCAACGVELPPGARFCPDCGTPTDVEGATARQEVPREETGPVPVSFAHAERHLFGVTPPALLLAVAAGLLVLALVLFVAGHWPFGLIVVGLAALLFAAFLESARRRPGASPVTRASADARERAGSLLETWRARAAATAEVRRIHSGLAVVEAERRTALLELGAAAHRGDGMAEAGVRARLTELDAREAELRSQLELRLAHAGERIRKARLAVQETMMVTPNQPSEPYPPPGEATPPQPATVPEAYPPPDEGTPPAPARVPEPSPQPSPDRDG
ncbi:MAG: zinc-ribbon domain [Gaiellaceae bacterium]|jgi:hypothetical protein|nr:zinc-ribbon domain [Gaiellaceae bacterium]MDX6469798.1 zinc-ribbon domain [Gaiellaceae bacterium]MDX6471656.1 zinc-ribbon domain [Gaiellaceae bacterium]